MQVTPAILIVDDNPANRRLYQAVLQDQGAELYMAGSGEEALALFGQRPYAMVLLDVHLSGISGFDVAQQLREHRAAAETPIVFVSALYTHERDTYRGYRLGAVDYILSPVVPEVLRAKAAVFIRLHRMRRETEEQSRVLERAYRELRTVHAEMEGFSYSVSHDLRTPLGQIMGFSDLLALGHAGELSDKAREYVGHVQGAAQRMSELIDDMLLLANMTRTEMQAQTVNLTHMADEIAQELRVAQPTRRVAWRSHEHLVAHGDPRLLRVALSNLIGNAMKYSAGVPDASVEFGSIEQGGEPVFFVRDNGAGFDAQAAGERLFRPFQRFHTEASFQGNGVGLAIVQRVMSKHGGRIWVDSAPGQGASFYFTLPAQPLVSIN